jgi:RNA polymerase sigma factor FliA
MSNPVKTSRAPLTEEQRALAMKHLDLVEEQARYLASNFPRLTLDDLVSFGYLGLLQAAKNYRPETGIPFPKYASTRIRGQIIDDVRHDSRYSEKQTEKRKEIRRAQELLEEKRGRQEHLTETIEHLMDFLAANPMPQYVGFDRSDDHTAERGRALDLSNRLPAPGASPETAAHHARIRMRVREAAKELGTDERDLVSRIYFRNMNLQDAADDLGLKKSWASRLHARAVEAIQAAFGRHTS